MDGARRRNAERQAISEARAIYRHADAAYAPYSCPASGECCQLAQRQRAPWLWEVEWLLLREELEHQGRELPPARADGACPFLDVSGKRCSVYASRPFGCRTYFCERVRGPKHEPAEAVNALWQRLEGAAQQLNPDEAGPRPITAWHQADREADRGDGGDRQTCPGSPAGSGE